MPSSPVNIKYPIVPPVFGSFKPFVTAYDQPNAVEQFFNHQMPVQSSSSNHGALRRLTWQQEVLDSFRRGWQRGDCAVKVTLRGGRLFSQHGTCRMPVQCCLSRTSPLLPG